MPTLLDYKPEDVSDFLVLTITLRKMEIPFGFIYSNISDIYKFLTFRNSFFAYWITGKWRNYSSTILMLG